LRESRKREGFERSHDVLLGCEEDNPFMTLLIKNKAEI